MKRRQFMRLACLSSLIPLVNLRADEALAPDEVSVDDPIAKALKYVLDAKEAKGNPKYKEGDNCSNCMFFRPQQNDGCALFGNRRVRKEGWCESWVKMQ